MRTIKLSLAVSMLVTAWVATFGARVASAPHPAGIPAERTAASAGYGWPVQPFDRIHPIRANFGDPRTAFFGPPTQATLYSGSGDFSFHNGVDIAAPDGAAVYAVRDGTVVFAAAGKVIVRCARGAGFEYWHVTPAVEQGQRVKAHRTVLGHILHGYMHVHLIERVNGRPTNPLAAGHLTPYDDTTTPRIDEIQLRRPGTSTELLPELVRGAVELYAPAYDVPKPAAPGDWATMTTAPAEVSWRIERARDHAVRVRERVAFDVRSRLPRRRGFWNTYARGTRQNLPRFRQHQYHRQQGVLFFKLGVVDTRKLRDGIYEVVVTASDIRGNSATRRETFLVYNHHHWPQTERDAARTAGR